MCPIEEIYETLRNIIEGIKNGESHLGRETNHYNNGSFSKFNFCTSVDSVVSDKGVEVEGEVVPSARGSSFRKFSYVGE